MESGRPSPGAIGHRIYEAPPTDQGSSSGRSHVSRLARFLLSDEGGPSIDDTPEAMAVSDSEKVSEGVEEFLQELHGNYRHAAHNDRLLKAQEHYRTRDVSSEEDHAANEIEKMAFGFHDFVDTLLNPANTARKLGLPEDQADDIKTTAMGRVNELIDEVGDQDGLIKALLFAIDSYKWEEGGRVWRTRATHRIKELVDAGELDERSGQILEAAVNKTEMPEDVSGDELTEVLKTKGTCLIDLKLGEISEVTNKYNVKGLFIKAVETLDNIMHPPKGNPASTYRDCIEAINFFVPSLMVHGYRDLAADLRGAALKWFYDDPNGDAKHQYDVSERYYEPLQDIILGLKEKEFGGIEIDVPSRLKREGAIREKLSKDDYQGLHRVPDGIGFAFVVPDDMSSKEIELFARSYQQRLITINPHIVVKHPNPNEKAFERKRRENGYEAIHMTFSYYADEEVSFEIQVLSQTQYNRKLLGQYSDLYYKGGTEYSPDDQPHLDHFAKRGQAEREMAPASTVQSIAELIALTNDTPWVFSKLFRAVDTGRRQRIIVPTILEKIASENADMLDRISGDPEELTVLPAAWLSEGQFVEALSMLGPGLATDKNILNALALIRKSESSRKRADGITTVIEGHLLPTALSALMLAIQSGKIWDSEEFGPIEYMSNVVTVALLHDYAEDGVKDIKDPVLMIQKRQEMLFDIRSKFGTTIMNGVAAMTSPAEIEDDDERRIQYAKNLQANDLARIIKPADRWQNHVTDLIQLAIGQAPPGSAVYNRKMAYFAKTDSYLSAAFTSEELPEIYPRVHDIIWRFARYFGYDPENTNEEESTADHS